LQRALQEGLLPPDFDSTEYFYYDSPHNGDMHRIGKFIAFRGPDDHSSGATCAGAFRARDYLEVFTHHDVSTVIRLNSPQYNAKTFTQAGFEHYDLVFHDCATPSDTLVDRFLTISELAEGKVAVHCLAGLGRTGTLIGLYLMKHHRLTAHEAIAWLRISRPGSVIGPQQAFLVEQQERMHLLGAQGCSGMGLREDLPVLDGQSCRLSLGLLRDRLSQDPHADHKGGAIEEQKHAGSLSSAAGDGEGEGRRGGDESGGTPLPPASDLSSESLAHMVAQGSSRRACLRMGALTHDSSDSILGSTSTHTSSATVTGAVTGAVMGATEISLSALSPACATSAGAGREETQQQTQDSAVTHARTRARRPTAEHPETSWERRCASFARSHYPHQWMDMHLDTLHSRISLRSSLR
jgi:protein-tyrosine phosphatase